MKTPNLIAAQANFGTGLQPVDGSGDPIYTEGLTGAIDAGTPASSLELLISNIIGLLTSLGAVVFIFMFFFAAFKWITSGEDAGKVQKARDQMVQAVIGLVIMVAGYAIIGLIGSIIGLDILNPASQIGSILGLTGI